MMGLGELFNMSGRARLTAVAASALLAACGGGDQAETFRPERIVTLGDENSLILPDGLQYTVNNALAANPPTVPAAVASCTRSPIWVQYVAAEYDLRFGECFGTPAQPYAVMKATLGGTIASSRSAFQAVNAATPLTNKVLVTLMAGTHDLLALASTNPEATGPALDALKVLARQHGEDLGALAFEITSTGARVLVTTQFNLSITPLGLSGTPANREVLSNLTVAFNDGLNAKLSTDPNGGGRSGAILEVDQQIEKYRRNKDNLYPAFTRNDIAACQVGGVPMDDASLPTCNLGNMQVNGNTYLWAGRLQFGLLTHAQLGNDAVARVRANPL